MLSKRLKELRLRDGYTQKFIADYLSISPSTVGMYEQGRRDPDYQTLHKLAELFKAPLDYLLGFSDNEHELQNYNRQLLEINKEINNLNEKINKFDKNKSSGLDLDNLITKLTSLEMLRKNIYDLINDYQMGIEYRKVKFPFSLNTIPLGERIKIPIVGTVKAGPNGLAYEDFDGEEWVEKDDINGGEYFWLKVRGDSMLGDAIMPGDLALVRVQPEVEDGEIAIVLVNDEEGTIKRVFKKENSIVLQSSNPSYPPQIFTGNELSKVKIVGKVKQIKRKF